MHVPAIKAIYPFIGVPKSTAFLVTYFFSPILLNLVTGAAKQTLNIPTNGIFPAWQDTRKD